MRVTAALLFLAGAAAPLLAHDGPHAEDFGPSAWDVTVLTLLGVLGLLYAAGSARLARRGARVRRLEPIAFWTGWIALVAAVAPPMDRAAALTFSMHMVQHELLMLIGAPLIIVGRPIVPWLWALPSRLRGAGAAGLQSRSVSGLWHAVTTPLVAWALHGIVIWIWHIPSLYEAAVRSEAVHVLQHAMFVASAVFFWWGLVYGRYGRAAYGASALYVFTTMVHTGILGAAFTFSTTPYYGVYRERALAYGVDPLTDQQLAGLFMWIPAGVVLTVCGLALVVAWLAEAERRSAQQDRTAAGGRSILLLLAGALAASPACRAIPHATEARQLTGGDPYRGREVIRHYGCDSCHTIPGVPTADATVGPPLTAVARRQLLAGHIVSTPENMMRWIQHPRAHDEKTAMPEMGVTPEDSKDITAFLYTLR